MPGHSDAALRLCRTLSAVELECQCRTKLDEALDRFSAFEGRRQLRSGLREARHRRVMIADQISFLADIDEIDEHETDLTVFEKIGASVRRNRQPSSDGRPGASPDRDIFH